MKVPGYAVQVASRLASGIPRASCVLFRHVCRQPHLCRRRCRSVAISTDQKWSRLV